MDWVSIDVAGRLMLLFDIVLNEGRDDGDGCENADGRDDGYNTINGEEGRRSGSKNRKGGRSRRSCRDECGPGGGRRGEDGPSVGITTGDNA